MDTQKQELIEDLPLGADDLIYLLLIVAGKKPAAWLQYDSCVWREGDGRRHISSQAKEQIESTLRDIGVAYKIESRVTDAGLEQPSNGRRRMHELMDIFVAEDAAALKRLLDAREAKNWPELGHALGYPETAVQAFTTDNRLRVDELPLETQLSETAQFVGFILSKEHWQDELRQVEEWAGVLKETSPIVYHQYLNRYSSIDRELAEKLLERLSS